MLGNGAAWVAVVLLVAGFAGGEPAGTMPASQPAATQAAGVDADRIAALIGQMGSLKFPERQKAQKALVQMGAAAEPALRMAAASSTNAEIRRRAATAIDQIEKGLPDAPTLVVVRADKESPGKILAAMADQAGISIAPHDPSFWNQNAPNAQHITLHLGRVPVLVALEKFCQAAQACPSSNGDTDDVFSLVSGPCGPWDQQDRMAVIANQISQTRQIQFSTGANTRTDSLNLTFLVDPKRPLVDHQMPRLVKAVDENGVSLANAVAPQDGGLGDSLQGTCSFDADLALNIPAQRGKMLAHLQGTILLRVATKTQRIAIPDLAKAVHGPGVLACDRKLEVVSFNFNGAAGDVNFRISNTIAQNLLTAMEAKGQSFDLNAEFRSCHIVDANGTPLWFDNSSSDSSDRQLNWQGHFMVNNSPPLKPPFSLKWDLVAESKDITVPFEFRNLPLPQP